MSRNTLDWTPIPVTWNSFSSIEGNEQMSQKRTVPISRKRALARISLIWDIVRRKDYKTLGERSFEQKNDIAAIAKFIDDGLDFSVFNIANWTDREVGDRMSEPFFRFSAFENYSIFQD